MRFAHKMMTVGKMSDPHRTIDVQSKIIFQFQILRNLITVARKKILPVYLRANVMIFLILDLICTFSKYFYVLSILFFLPSAVIQAFDGKAPKSSHQ